MRIVGPFLEHSFPCNFHHLSLRIQFLANSAPPACVVQQIHNKSKQMEFVGNCGTEINRRRLWSDVRQCWGHCKQRANVTRPAPCVRPFRLIAVTSHTGRRQTVINNYSCWLACRLDCRHNTTTRRLRSRRASTQMSRTLYPDCRHFDRMCAGIMRTSTSCQRLTAPSSVIYGITVCRSVTHRDL